MHVVNQKKWFIYKGIIRHPFYTIIYLLYFKINYCMGTLVTSKCNAMTLLYNYYLEFFFNSNIHRHECCNNDDIIYYINGAVNIPGMGPTTS